MTKRVSTAQAKAHLSELLAQVAYAGERVLIERRGKAMAALVCVDDLAQLDRNADSCRNVPRPQGALALAGAWRDVPEAELDALVADVFAARQQDTGRSVALELDA
jgi:prevent-host-death family protein